MRSIMLKFMKASMASRFTQPTGKLVCAISLGEILDQRGCSLICAAAIVSIDGKINHLEAFGAIGSLELGIDLGSGPGSGGRW